MIQEAARQVNAVLIVTDDERELQPEPCDIAYLAVRAAQATDPLQAKTLARRAERAHAAFVAQRQTPPGKKPF